MACVHHGVVWHQQAGHQPRGLWALKAWKEAAAFTRSSHRRALQQHALHLGVGETRIPIQAVALPCRQVGGCPFCHALHVDGKDRTNPFSGAQRALGAQEL